MIYNHIYFNIASKRCVKNVSINSHWIPKVEIQQINQNSLNKTSTNLFYFERQYTRWYKTYINPHRCEKTVAGIPILHIYFSGTPNRPTVCTIDTKTEFLTTHDWSRHTLLTASWICWQSTRYIQISEGLKNVWHDSKYPSHHCSLMLSFWKRWRTRNNLSVYMPQKFISGRKSLNNPKMKNLNTIGMCQTRNCWNP